MNTYLRPREAEIVIHGSDLAAMQAAAEEQFGQGFGEAKWEITEISARLDMLSVGTSPNEWVPGLWSATYKAVEIV